MNDTFKSDNAAVYADILKNTEFSVQNLKLESPLPYSEDFSRLAVHKAIGGKNAANRICYQPMEGQDAAEDDSGDPTELTFRRYETLACGGPGILWLEAVSVLPEARSNRRQLMITKENLDKYKRLVDSAKEACLKNNGFEPYFVLQLNHSGRYSKPDGSPRPITAMKNPFFDKPGISYSIASDEYLSGLPEIFAEKAALCEKAGFDAVDVKCCHGYLFSEMLSAYDRPGRYGGSFENRTRLVADTVGACRAALSNRTAVACRLNIYDGYDSPYSFGTNRGDFEKYDLDEPEKLISLLVSRGLSLLNVTMGSPYVNPDVSRPYRPGVDKPKTNALYALSRLLNGAREIHKAFPDLVVVNTGVSGFCSKSAYAAAGMIAEDMTDFVGFGRMNFAYPSLARDILANCYDEKKCCVACSGCSTLKKNGLLSGCIVRNPLYKKIYREFISK